MNQPLLLVFVGGGIGSVLRYLTIQWLPTTLLSLSFPWAILVVNMVACTILGYLMGWILSHSSEEVRLFLGVGICGGLSTFSSFSYDLMILLQQGRVVAAVLNIVLNVTLCTALSVLGFWIGQKYSV